MSKLERAVQASKHAAAIAYVEYGACYYARTVNGKIVVRFNGFRDDLEVPRSIVDTRNLAWCPQTFTRTGCDVGDPVA